MTREFLLSLAVLGAAACNHGAANAPASMTVPQASLPEAEHERLAFVQAACGGCHAVETPGLSPNPASPPFAQIANRAGLTRATLLHWLSDAHNYPEVMDFDLDEAQVEQIADYILTLRSAGYRRLPG